MYNGNVPKYFRNVECHCRQAQSIFLDVWSSDNERASLAAVQAALNVQCYLRNRIAQFPLCIARIEVCLYKLSVLKLSRSVLYLGGKSIFHHRGISARRFRDGNPANKKFSTRETPPPPPFVDIPALSYSHLFSTKCHSVVYIRDSFMAMCADSGSYRRKKTQIDTMSCNWLLNRKFLKILNFFIWQLIIWYCIYMYFLLESSFCLCIRLAVSTSNPVESRWRDIYRVVASKFGSRRPYPDVSTTHDGAKSGDDRRLFSHTRRIFYTVVLYRASIFSDAFDDEIYPRSGMIYRLRESHFWDRSYLSKETKARHDDKLLLLREFSLLIFPSTRMFDGFRSRHSIIIFARSICNRRTYYAYDINEYAYTKKKGKENFTYVSCNAKSRSCGRLLRLRFMQVCIYFNNQKREEILMIRAINSACVEIFIARTLMKNICIIP